MADKPPTAAPPTLEELARAEAHKLELQEQKKQLYLRQQAALLKETPARFFTLARQVREGVGRFNGAAKLPKPLVYHETAAVTVRDPNPAADFFVEVRRDPSWASLALRQQWRLHADDAFVIEGEGRVGVDPNPERFHLRINGVYQGETLRWRILGDGQEIDTSIDELADRLVAVVATGEVSRLWTMAPFLDREKDKDRSGAAK